MTFPRLNRIHIWFLAVALLTLTSQVSAQKNLQPDTALAAQTPLMQAINDLGILQGLLQDPKNWNDTKLQDFALKRISFIQVDLLELFVLLQQAAQGDDVPAGMANGMARSNERQYSILLAIIGDGLPQAIRKLGEDIARSLEDAADAIEGDVTPEVCNNGRDDDRDMLIDEEDPDCEPIGDPI